MLNQVKNRKVKVELVNGIKSYTITGNLDFLAVASEIELLQDKAKLLQQIQDLQQQVAIFDEILATKTEETKTSE